MDIEIKNEEQAINTCQQILSYNQQSSSHVQSLESTLRKINTKWESSGRDKESYVMELEKQVSNLRTLGTVINDLTTSILQYAENIKETSKKKVSE